MTGQVSYLAGLAAEEQVAEDYLRRGRQILSRRWRGPLGEIDLVAQKNGEVVFVEVKKARSFAAAAERLTARQIKRIYSSAEDYLGRLATGLNTACRFDVALVNNIGQIDICENAIQG